MSIFGRTSFGGPWAPLGIAEVLIFFFLYETQFAREADQEPFIQLPDTFFANRIKTLFFGQATVRKFSAKRLVRPHTQTHKQAMR
jgi:hypothetical protein